MAVMPSVALVSSHYALTSPVDADREIGLLAAALRARGVRADVVDWQEPAVDWGGYDLAILKSPWGYHLHPAAFATWLTAVEKLTRVLNPPDVVRWNLDKTYLAALAQSGVAVCPSFFASTDEQVRSAIAACGAPHVVIKPTVSAASADTGLFAADDPAALALGATILGSGKTVLVQPALESVAAAGERSQVFCAGRLVHAVRKGPLLALGGGLLAGDEYAETITAEPAPPDEQQLAHDALAAAADLLPEAHDLLYARVDVARDAEDRPVLMELELFEPSWFLDLAPGAEHLFADAVVARLPS